MRTATCGPGLEQKLNGKGALRQVTSRGGLVMNSYVGRSRRPVTPQAHDFSSDRLIAGLSQPPAARVSGHRGSHTFEVSGRAWNPVHVLQCHPGHPGHPGWRSPPPCGLLPPSQTQARSREYVILQSA